MKRFIPMQWIKYTMLGSFFLLSGLVRGQITGGQYAFEFLRLSNSPHVSALGGISVADPENDISFALQNPAMMRAGLHNELALDYNSYYAGTNILNLQYGYNVPKLNTAFFLGVQYLNYGSITQTDNIGNIVGSFNPTDYAITIGGSRTYGEHWRYGVDLKFAHSNLFSTAGTATAIVGDVGLNYYDTTRLWDFGVVAKNMGTMVQNYTSGNTEPMPFDLQIGVSKGLKHVPLKLFVTVHHFYEWGISYNDPAMISASNVLGTTDSTAGKSSNFTDNLFRHFIFGAELSLAKRITITASYNHLQHQELALESTPGLAGFAFGVGLHLNSFDVHYARTYYHIAGAYNEIGITMALSKLFGIGELGEKIGWNTQYPDWGE